MTDSATQNKVLSIRLPLEGKTVLLPYSLVAEVASLSLRPKEGSFLGAVECVFPFLVLSAGVAKA